MDALSTRLLALVMDPNATMEQMLAGMEALNAALDADNVRMRRINTQTRRSQIANASGADLRKLAQANLARKYAR